MSIRKLIPIFDEEDWLYSNGRLPYPPYNPIPPIVCGPDSTCGTPNGDPTMFIQFKWPQVGNWHDVTDVTLDTLPLTITTASNHGLNTGDIVEFEGVSNDLEGACNNHWSVTVTSPNEFEVAHVVSSLIPGNGRCRKLETLSYQGCTYFNGEVKELFPTTWEYTATPVGNSFRYKTRWAFYPIDANNGFVIDRRVEPMTYIKNNDWYLVDFVYGNYFKWPALFFKGEACYQVERIGCAWGHNPNQGSLPGETQPVDGTYDLGLYSQYWNKPYYPPVRDTNRPGTSLTTVEVWPNSYEDSTPLGNGQPIQFDSSVLNNSLTYNKVDDTPSDLTVNISKGNNWPF